MISTYFENNIPTRYPIEDVYVFKTGADYAVGSFKISINNYSDRRDYFTQEGLSLIDIKNTIEENNNVSFTQTRMCNDKESTFKSVIEIYLNNISSAIEIEELILNNPLVRESIKNEFALPIFFID